MKKNILTTIATISLMSLFTACGGGGGSSSSTTPVALADIVLTASQTTTCTNATSFTVTPTDNPITVFSTDTESGDTTVTIEAGSAGSVLIENCTTK